MSHFVRVAWPQAGVAFVLLGAFGFGIPSIALTGGHDLAEGLALPDGTTIASLIAAALLVGAAATVRHGTTLASRWRQNALMVALLLILVVRAGSTLPRWGGEFHWSDAAGLPAIPQGMALAFFIYTGRELFAALSEEIRNRRRDFPLAVVISFVAVSLLYLRAALAVQSTVAVGDPRLISAPFLPVVEALVGGSSGRAVLGGLVALFIVANLVGAVWTASRLVFDMGRNGFLPVALDAGQLDARGTPARALATVLIGFLTVIVLHLAVGVPLDIPLTLVGQNVFLLYLACVAVFVKIVPDPRERAFALLVLVGLLAFAGAFGWSLLYPLPLFTLLYATRQGRVVDFGRSG